VVVAVPPSPSVTVSVTVVGAAGGRRCARRFFRCPCCRHRSPCVAGDRLAGRRRGIRGVEVPSEGGGGRRRRGEGGGGIDDRAGACGLIKNTVSGGVDHVVGVGGRSLSQRSREISFRAETRCPVGHVQVNVGARDVRARTCVGEGARVRTGIDRLGSPCRCRCSRARCSSSDWWTCTQDQEGCGST